MDEKRFAKLMGFSAALKRGWYSPDKTEYKALAYEEIFWAAIEKNKNPNASLSELFNAEMDKTNKAGRFIF